MFGLENIFADTPKGLQDNGLLHWGKKKFIGKDGYPLIAERNQVSEVKDILPNTGKRHFFLFKQIFVRL